MGGKKHVGCELVWRVRKSLADARGSERVGGILQIFQRQLQDVVG
jgi:hypothetical protein